MLKQDEFGAVLKKSKAFDDLEIRILNAVINLEKQKLKKINAAMIGKEAGLTATNTYKYLYSLQQKGFIESTTANNMKYFWLSRSANPFPRMLSQTKKEYMTTEDNFTKLAKMYEEFVDPVKVWGNEKIKEKYEGDYFEKVAFLFDVAKHEIFVSSPGFYGDVVLLDAIRRAVERGVSIRFVVEEMDPKLSAKLKTIGIETRLGSAKPYFIVVDGRHGIVENDFWFLNYMTSYRDEFEKLWNNADDV